MGKVILASLLAGSLGGAALVTVGQTYYSSSFQYDFCPGGAFKVTPSPGNVWHWEGDATVAGTSVLVDFNGDGTMDTEHPDVRVCITDFQNGDGGSQCQISDSSGVRWTLNRMSETHLTTPIVLPVGSHLTVRLSEGGASPTSVSRIRLIGRIVNI